MAVISGLRIGKINVWPGDVLDSYDRIGGMSNQQVTEALQTVAVTSDNSTEPMRLIQCFSTQLQYKLLIIQKMISFNSNLCRQIIKIDYNIIICHTTDL